MTKNLSLLSLAVLLAACGGGGDNQVADAPRPHEEARDPILHYGLDPDDSDHRRMIFSLNGQTIVDVNTPGHGFMDPNGLPRGLSAPLTMNVRALRNDNGRWESEDVAARSYRGYHSAIVVVAPLQTIRDSNQTTPIDPILPYLQATSADSLPRSGRATYQGQAFGVEADNIAALTYHLDFGQKTGHGEIAANPYHSLITLHRNHLYSKRDMDLTYYTVEGAADSSSHPYSGEYEVMLAGPQAEEIIGRVDITKKHQDEYIVLHGTRGNITP